MTFFSIVPHAPQVGLKIKIIAPVMLKCRGPCSWNCLTPYHATDESRGILSSECRKRKLLYPGPGTRSIAPTRWLSASPRACSTCLHVAPGRRPQGQGTPRGTQSHECSLEDQSSMVRKGAKTGEQLKWGGGRPAMPRPGQPTVHKHSRMQ